jgi:hypothetical protein
MSSNYGGNPSPKKTSSKATAMPVGSPMKTRSRTKAMAVALPVQSSKSRSSSKAPSSKSRSSSKASASVSPVKSPRKSKKSAAPSKQRVSRKRVYKALSKSKAQKAFNDYYANRDYSSETRRNAAMKRDLNSSPRNASKIVKDERYLLNPGRYDYPGVDAGPNVSKYSGNLSALKLAHKAPRSGRRSHSQVLKEIKRSK